MKPFSLILLVVIMSGNSGYSAETSQTLTADTEDGSFRKNSGKEIIFTATVLNKIRPYGVFPVVLTLEESPHPKVTFNLTLLDEKHEVIDWEVLTLTEGFEEQKRLDLHFIRSTKNHVDLIVSAFPPGFPQLATTTNISLPTVDYGEKLFVLTDKNEYAVGDIVAYQVAIIDPASYESVEYPRLIHVEVTGNLSTEPYINEVQIIYKKGIVKGNFTFQEGMGLLEVSMTSERQSYVVIATDSIPLSEIPPSPSEILSVHLEVNTTTFSFSNPHGRATVSLKSAEGLPEEGLCEVSLADTHNSSQGVKLEVDSTNNKVEFDMAKEMGFTLENTGEVILVDLKATCTHLSSGVKVNRKKFLRFLKNFTGDAVTSFGTVVHTHKFASGLFVPPEVLKSTVTLAHQDTNDNEPPLQHPLEPPVLELSVPDPSRLYRKEEDVKVLVRSRHSFSRLSAVLCTSKEIYLSKGIPVSPYDGNADIQVHEFITFSLDREHRNNLNEEYLNFIVYGLKGETSSNERKELHSASIKINLAPSTGSQQLNLVDQIDNDFSTIFNLELEGQLKNSLVVVQGRRLSIHDDDEDEHIRNLEFKFERNFRKFAFDPDVEKASIISGIEVENAAPVLTSFYSPIFLMEHQEAEKHKPFPLKMTFDRRHQFGNYLLNALTLDLNTGEKWISNSKIVTIQPPHVTIGLYVPQSILLGETMEAVAKVLNPSEIPFKGHVLLTRGEGKPRVFLDELVEVKPGSSHIFQVPITPEKVGDLVLSLGITNSSILTKTKTVEVKDLGIKHTFTKYLFLQHTNSQFQNVTSGTGTMTSDIHRTCHPPVLNHGDIFADILRFFDTKLFDVASKNQEVRFACLRIVFSLGSYFYLRRDAVSLKKVISIFESITGCERCVNPETFHEDTVGSLERYAGMKDVYYGSIYKKDKDGFFDLALSVITLHRHYATVDILAQFGYTQNLKEGLRRALQEERLDDPYPQSIITLLFTEINEPEASLLLSSLENKRSSDVDGVFWKSKWAGDLEFRSTASIPATAFALMTYVKLNKLEEAKPIASWLLAQSSLEGIYSSLEDTAAVVESLSKYAKLLWETNRLWPSGLRTTQECVSHHGNISGSLNVSIETQMGKEGLGQFSLSICRVRRRDLMTKVVEVSLPSGYVAKRNDVIMGKGKSEFLFIFPGNASCSVFDAKRTSNVTRLDSSGIQGNLTGSVTSYGLRDMLRKSVQFFYV